jgi:hypothetical protein
MKYKITDIRHTQFGSVITIEPPMEERDAQRIEDYTPKLEWHTAKANYELHIGDQFSLELTLVTEAPKGPF